MRSLGTVAAVVTLVLGLAAAPAPAPAPVEPTAPIHPGIGTVTGGNSCTANYVFEGRRTIAGKLVTDLYLGIAAHCAGTGGNIARNGCSSGTHGIGTPVELRGADGRTIATGTLAYSSWIAMQSRGESAADVCAANDLALVRIPTSHHAQVDPTVPYFGGPTALGGPTSLGEQVRAYGNSSLRLGVTSSSPQRGVSLGTSRGGWTHVVYQASPGIPGDSGSAVLHADGRALGVLVTLGLTPYPASNGITDLRKALAYANAYGGLGSLTLVPGRAPFADPLTD